MFGLNFSLAAAQAFEHVSILTDRVAMPKWDGVSVTVQSYGNGRRAAAVEGPTVFRRLIQVETPAANRLFGRSQQFTGFNIYAKPYFLGAVADVYRVSGAVLSHVRRSTVTGGAIDRWSEIGIHREKTGKKKGRKGKKNTPADSMLIGDTTYDHTFVGYNRTGVPYWFAVAAVDAEGNIGPKSAPLAMVPTTAGGKGNRGTEDGTVPGPPLTDVMAEIAAPEGLRADTVPGTPGLVRLGWNPVAGAVGYIPYLAFADPATEIVDEPYLDLTEDDVALEKGDVVILSKKFLTQSPDEINPRVWGTGDWDAAVPSFLSNKQNDPAKGTHWQWMRFDDADQRPAPHLGDWFLRRTIAPGAAISDGRYFHAGLGQSFYPTLRPGRTWRWRARLRASRPVTLTLDLGEKIPGASFALTTEWQECIHEFAVGEIDMGRKPGNWAMVAKAEGEELTVDCCEVELGDTAMPLYIDDFPVAPGTFVRDHSQIKPGASTSDADTVTNISGQGARVTTLYTLREICAHFGARPWIQLEWHLPKEDWLDIAAYLAAPVSSGHPMALKRASQGHETPWTEAFDRIVFEFGNESWNQLSAFWSTPSMPGRSRDERLGGGEVYGLWCQMITGWMAESPFWPAIEARMEWFLGGWARTDYGAQAARRFPRARYVGIAAYNSGWDEGVRAAREDGGFLATMLSYAPLNGARSYSRLVENTRLAAEATGRVFGTDLIPAIYEAGPGYQVDGLNGSEVSQEQSVIQEVVMKSRGSATAAVDNFLMSAEMGLWGANYFRIGRGNSWNSTTFNGQADVDFPPYTLPRLITEEIAPAQVHEVQHLRPLQHRLADREDKEMAVNSAAVYALRAIATPSTWMLVFINRLVDPAVLDPGDPDYSRDRPNRIKLTLRTPWSRVGGLTEWVNAGNFREHNRYPPGQRLGPDGGFVPDPLCVTIDFPATPGTPPADPSLISVDLPAASCLIWKLTGVS